jgi:hypothetical protein
LFVDKHLFNVNDITYNQHFRLKEQNGVTKIWCKQYCSSKWYPEGGLNIFRTEPTGTITCAPRHPLRSIEERARFLIDGVKGDTKSSLDGIKANLVALVKYIPPSSVNWWNEFLEIQESEDFDKTSLQHEFAWPDPGEDGNVQEEDEGNGAPDEAIENMFPEERPMYTGARRTRQYRQERQGDLTDMLIGHFVALRAIPGEEENEKAFHIAKVMRILPEKKFEVHWYAERGTGKYYPFNEKGRDGRVTKKAVLQTFGWDCGVLCYNFKLKADKSLLANTLGKINELLNSVPIECDENDPMQSSDSNASPSDSTDEDGGDGGDSGDGEESNDSRNEEVDEENDDIEEDDEDAPLRRTRHR